MSLFSSIFGEKGPVEAKAVAADPSSIPADGNFPNSFEISDAFSIAPKPLEVGLKRSMELKDRAVVYGTVSSGSFTQGDTVIVTINNAPMQMSLLDVLPEGASDFATELGANMHKKTIDAGKYGWLILDVTSLPAVNTKVGKL